MSLHCVKAMWWFLSFPCAFIASSSLYVCVLVLCVQDSTSRPGGEDPSYSPECFQHGHQGGADTAKQYGARKRYSTYHHHQQCEMLLTSYFTFFYVMRKEVMSWVYGSGRLIQGLILWRSALIINNHMKDILRNYITRTVDKYGIYCTVLTQHRAVLSY